MGKIPLEHIEIFSIMISYNYNFAFISEWVEMLRLLGVTKIVVHNSTLGVAVSRVLLHYEKTGLVQVKQRRPLVGATDEILSDQTIRNSVVLTDCMYRNMYRMKRIFVIDFDEIIIPQTSLRYDDMITQINSTFGLGFVFHNHYFMMDLNVHPDAVDFSEPVYSSVLRYRQRLATSKQRYLVKSLVNPAVCAFVWNHLCLYGVDNFKVYLFNSLKRSKIILHFCKPVHMGLLI